VDAQLPEIVRLAWLLSQLNVDLPLFSETIHRDRLPLVASLAMLPPALTAAQSADLARCDRPTVQRSLASWIVDKPPEPELADMLLSWWDTYTASRPAWHVAISALDRMLQ
jgi:hypothetical protein